MIIDTHCHVYLEEFNEELTDVLKRAKEVGVQGLCMPNIDLSSIDAMMAISQNDIVPAFPMMGLHPCYVKEDYKEVIKIMESFISKYKFYAIGEIGIDLYWDKSMAHEQMQAFEYQIGLASELALPIIIHSREALDLTIQTVRKFQKGSLQGIFHCFSGTEAQLMAITDLGFLIGIGGVVTYKKSGLLELLTEHTPLNLVYETDSPYLAPVPYRGKRNEPSYISHVAEMVSKVYHTKDININHIALNNSKKIFGI